MAIFRRSDLPYVCVTDPWGHRWHAAILASGTTSPMFDLADLSAQVIEVGDTPTVVTVTA